MSFYSFRLRFFSASVLLLAALYCTPAKTSGETRQPDARREWNDIARLLGGLPAEAGSTMTRYDSTPDAEKHRLFFDKIWPEIEKNQLGPQKAWRDQEIGKVEGFIFYPFSGPDFLNIFTFYPDGNNYAFFGLEPPGAPPTLKDIPDPQIAPSLAGLQGSLRSILNYSFFQTLHMINDLKATKLSGVAPVLLAFIVRTGNQVVSVRSIRVMPDGNIAEDPDAFETGSSDVPVVKEPDAKDGKKVEPVIGIRVYFKKAGQSKSTAIDYFSVDISDQAMAEKPFFLAHIKSRGKPATYLKAASYLMYGREFGTIRNFILDESRTILQDDSGIPLQYFDQTRFDLKFFGVYTRPIPLFDAKYQPNLRAMYLPPNKTKPLDFGIGYRFGKGDSNLMLATRKPGAPPKSADAPEIQSPEKK